MKFEWRSIALIMICYLLLASATPAIAMIAGDLEDLKVNGYFFTTTISNSQRTYFVKDVSKSRNLVVLMSANLQKGDGKVFTNDFILRYFHRDGKEDRTQCEAIAIAKTPGMGDIGELAIGPNASSIKLDRGWIYFALAFCIEPDVEAVEIYRVGSTGPLIYRIGTERPYSVYITTNTDTIRLSEVKRVIEEGGYQVTFASTTLAKDTTGVTIHYRENIETHAREISQRLIAKLGIVPSLKKMALISEVDFVIWLGK